FRVTGVQTCALPILLFSWSQASSEDDSGIADAGFLWSLFSAVLRDGGALFAAGGCSPLELYSPNHTLWLIEAAFYTYKTRHSQPLRGGSTNILCKFR